MSSPHPSHISKREVSSRPRASLSEAAQPDTGPSGVDAQSCARIWRAMSLSPTKTSSCTPCGDVDSELICPLVDRPPATASYFDGRASMRGRIVA
jgi:hypothetical protein